MTPQWVNVPTGASHVAVGYVGAGWSLNQHTLCGRIAREGYEYVPDGGKAKKPCRTCLASLSMLLRQGGTA